MGVQSTAFYVLVTWLATMSLDTGRGAVLAGIDVMVYQLFSLIGSLGNVPLPDLERTLNLGVGMVAIVDPSVAEAATRRLNDRGVPAWVMGDVVSATEPDTDSPDYVQGAKGVNGGAVRLFGQYA